GRWAELPVYRQTQHISIEMLASAVIGGKQQDPAAQNLHVIILAVGPTGDSARLAEPLTGQLPVPLRSSARPSHRGARKLRTMPDAIFAHQRLARIYDPLDPDRGDLDAYAAMAAEFGAR